MKIDGKQVHIRPRFCGKRHSAQLTEPALVLQGEIRKLSFPIVDMLFVRALSEWTTMTIPYSRLIKLRHGRRLWRWLGVFLGGCVAGLAGMALAVSSSATGLWAVVVGVVLLATGIVAAPIGLVVLLADGLQPQIRLTYQDARGKKSQLELWIRNRATRKEFFTQLEANWRTAATYVERAPAGQTSPARGGS